MCGSQGYAATQRLLEHASFIVTDSGGLQEEATWYGTPVLVLREMTERPEAAMAGLSIILGGGADGTLRQNVSLLCDTNSELRLRMSRRLLPFGDGQASARILKIMEENLHLLRQMATLKMKPVITNSTIASVEMDSSFIALM